MEDELICELRDFIEEVVDGLYWDEYHIMVLFGKENGEYTITLDNKEDEDRGFPTKEYNILKKQMTEDFANVFPMVKVKMKYSSTGHINVVCTKKKVNKKNWKVLKQSIKNSLLYADFGMDFQHWYEDPYEATRKMYMGKKRTYLQIINIFIKEIEQNIEDYLYNDLKDCKLDLTVHLDTRQYIKGCKMSSTSELINMEKFDETFKEVLDKYILK